MTMATMPKLWNLRDKHKVRIPRDAVYIGRGTPYGNPFIAGTHGSRARVIERFEAEVLPDLDVSDLRGKDLVCWCHPLPCHGEAIMEKANELPDGLWWQGGVAVFACRVCDRVTPWYAEPEDFDPDDDINHVCGGSPWCLP